MKYNTQVDLRKQESDIFKKTINESPEIGWFYEFYKSLQKIKFIIPKKRKKGELKENPAVFLEPRAVPSYVDTKSLMNRRYLAETIDR